MLTTTPNNNQLNHTIDRTDKTSVDYLFRKYEEIGFLYPEKKRLLTPHFKSIKNNWEKMLNSEKQLLWTVCKENQAENDFASISFFQQSNHGLLAQHLVSNGNPFLSLEVMLEAQSKVLHDPQYQHVQSSQNWFRPNNRYAYRVFASMLEKLGKEKAAVTSFEYLHLPLDEIQYKSQNRYYAQEVSTTDLEFISFVKSQYGLVFVKAEELDEEDLTLTNLNRHFVGLNLSRKRRILKIKDIRNDAIVGGVIANRAPTGLNFSFLENRAYYLLDPLLVGSEIEDVLTLINNAISEFYQDFSLRSIPIVTDTNVSRAIQFMGAKWMRTYLQSIWLKEGFQDWYDHIHAFHARIASRKKKIAAA